MRFDSGMSTAEAPARAIHADAASPTAAIATLAGRQYGVITRRQALSAGMSGKAIHNRLRSGEWQKLYPGVFRLVSSGTSWRQDLMAACLWAGNSAVASHRAAAAIWQLQGATPGYVEITVPVLGFEGTPEIIIHRSGNLPGCDVTTEAGIPITTPDRTLVDLGALVNEETLEILLDNALQRRLVTISSLRSRLRDLSARGRPGPPQLRYLLDKRDPSRAPSDSVLETLFRRLLDDWKFPPPESQYPVTHQGKTVAVLDFAYPELRVGIECEGYRDHGGRARFDRDLQRRNRLTGLQWTVLYVPWTEVRSRSERFRKELRRVLEAARRNALPTRY